MVEIHTHTYAYQRVKNVRFFRKIWGGLFS